MGFLLWTLLVIVLPFPIQSYRTPSPLLSNCLYRRSRCLHDNPCRLRIIEFDSICGVSSTECLASSPSDCVNLLWQMKHWLGDDRCDCHPLFGAARECNRFGHLLYEHPCESLLKREPEEEAYRSIGVTRDYGRRRTTRSPSSVQINEWKKQLSGDLFSLATSTQLQSQECDVALHQICLRHISCSQLWNLFRKNCVVDSDNTCIMQQREACWESFEGLLWTGLGRCHCSSNVSDCHWIRLHTNFNKCIYEISRSSGMSFSSFSPLSSPTPPTTRVSFVNFASQSLSTPSPITTTSPTPILPQSHLQSSTESSSIPILTISHPTYPSPHSTLMSVERQEDRSDGRIHINEQVPHGNHLSAPIDPRLSHPDYRTPSPPSYPPRNDDRSEIRVSYGQQQTTHHSSPGYTQSRSDLVTPSPYQPHSSPSQTVYSNPSSDQSRQIYRTQGESNDSSRSALPSSHDNRQGSEWNRPSSVNGREGSNSGDRENIRGSIQEMERSNRNEQVNTRQETDRWSQSNYRTQSNPSRPEYGRIENEGRGEDERGETTNRREEDGRRGENQRGDGRGRGSNQRMDERREESRRQDNRLGQITQSNGREERERGRVNRVNEEREESDESPQQISVVTNQERRNEYEVSSPGVSPSHYNPTIITASPAASRAKGIEEEKRRRKEEEEIRQREEKRQRDEKREREEKRRKEEEKRRKVEEKRRKEEEKREREEMREREEKRERGEKREMEEMRKREEKKEREEKGKMEERRRKEEEDRRQRERTEKIRLEEEEKKIEEMKRKEKEKDEKRREKLRQEKVASSRGGDNSDSSVAPSSSCLSALRECESVQECKFQLAELKTRCAMNCEKKTCQGALRRFSSFVPLPLSMALQFCSCPNDAENCPEKELLYPPCIYERNDLPRCESVEEECKREQKCKSLVSSMASHCSVVKGGCDGGTRCTHLLLKARGTITDTQCSCQPMDKHCLALQSTMIPNHPCLAESRREFYRVESQESPISLTTHKNDHSIDVTKKPSVVVPLTRLTTTSEPQVEEVESAPWITSTITVPTTTTVYTTHAPPPAEGCSLKDSKGRSLFFHVGSILRRNLDWSGRCSSWCECLSEEVLTCHGLPCSGDINCTSHSPQFTHQYGERLYLKDRGPCMCENGDYTCAVPPPPEIILDPGIYLFLGYSQLEIDLLEREMPPDVYQRAGFLSNKRATDIASQLQIVLESLLPPDLQCRLSVMDGMDSPGNVLLRVEWHGIEKRRNQTKVKWQTGMPEKACAKYIRTLEDLFDLDDSPRFQLVLSTVKQMKVQDLLDALPDSAPSYQSLFLIALLIYLRYLF